jgi:hypothetical protein
MTNAGTYESIEGKSNYQNSSEFHGITSAVTNDDVITEGGKTDNGTSDAVNTDDETVIVEDGNLTTEDEITDAGADDVESNDAGTTTVGIDDSLPT